MRQFWDTRYKKKLEAFKLEQDLGLGPSKFTDDVLKFE
jgi:hypothetical protein